MSVPTVEERSFDALVIGAGIIGAACARSLARSGRRVAILERGEPASATSARGEGNILVSDKAPGPELALALDARARWADLAAELRHELDDGFPDIEFEAKGGLVVATSDAGAEPLRAFAASQRAAGVLADDLPLDRARELEPWLAPGIAAAIHYPQDAQVQPVIVTEALLASARRAGARIVSGAEVRAATSTGGRITGLVTDAGTFRADLVVNAAGPWAAHVGAALGAPIDVRPRRGVVLVTTRMPHRVFHKVYDGDYVGATQSGDADLQTSSVIESTAAGTVLIGSSREQVGFDDRLRVDVLSTLARKAMRIFPFLEHASVMRSYGGFRPYVPDHLPVIGEDPRLAGLWHATGHEGAGIGLSVSTAVVLSALVDGAPTPVDALPFRVDRPGVVLEAVA